MFGLAMFRISGRGGPKDRDEAARLFAAAAKLGHAPRESSALHLQKDGALKARVAMD